MMNITSNTLQSDLSKFFLNLTLEKKEEISRQFGNTEVNNNAIDLFLNKISTITIDSDNEDHFTITLPKFFRLEISGFLTNFMTNHSTLFKINTGVAIKDPNFKNKIELIEDQIIIEGEDSLIYNFFVRQTRFNFLQELYLYTDIIEYQYIGSQMARLLRVVTVDNKKDSLIHLSYLDPHYLTVNKNRLDSILLKLTDERGEPVKFSDSTSRVIYKLHFRPINKT